MSTCRLIPWCKDCSRPELGTSSDLDRAQREQLPSHGWQPPMFEELDLRSGDVKAFDWLDPRTMFCSAQMNEALVCDRFTVMSCSCACSSSCE